MRILFCGTGWPEIVPFIQRRLGEGHEVLLRDMSRPLVEQVADVDVLLPSNGHVTAEVVAAASKLRLIQQPAAGFEGIDLEAARERDVPVCNAPAKNANAVAEAALLLMLMIARRVPEARRAFAARELGRPVGRELRGRRLGIVGFGQTGRALERSAQALGLEVRGVGSRGGRPGLLQLLGWADIVSLHLPLTAETRGLMDAEAFAAMREGSWFINCARGGIVDAKALSEALAGGRLDGVGLDVHAVEPADPTDPIYADDRVVALPHVAGSSEPAFVAIAEVVGANIERLAAGESLLHRVDR